MMPNKLICASCHRSPPVSVSALTGRFVATLAMLLSLSASAATLTGTVLYVVDGDTLDFAVPGEKTIRVRLREIDAPESKQAHGKASRDSLRSLCDRAPAQITTSGKYTYGRILGRVSCRGIDASRAQVKTGMAWVYDQYNTDGSLYADQAKARAAHRGLWADPAPTPPWEFRRRQ